jgi:phosphatidate phosphatase APP1
MMLFHSSHRLVLYYAYSNKQKLHLKGRLEKYVFVSPATPGDSWRSTVIKMIKRYLAKGVPNISVVLSIRKSQYRVKTNEMGFFETNLSVDEVPDNTNELQFDLIEDAEIESLDIHHCNVTHVARKDAGILVSDIDDTVIVSYSTTFWRKLQLLILKNPFQRKQVEQTYDVIVEHDGITPIFYVSSSEFQLFDYVKNILEHAGLPRGPLLLRESALHLYKLWKRKSIDHDHKFSKIKGLMNEFEGWDFTFLGDSGQQDLRIYQRIQEEYPEQVRVVYIREVRSLSEQERSNWKARYPNTTLHFLPYE